LTVEGNPSHRSELLVESDVSPALRTEWIGRRFHAYRRVESTNEMLLSGPFRGAPAGTVVVAEEQTKGRGRLDRRWEAPPFRAILFSLLLRPGTDPERASLRNIAAALAVAEGIADRTGVSLRIRWPNDLYGTDGKVCGILSEYRSGTGRLVVGVGLNVNQKSDELPEGGASLRTMTGRKHERGPLLASILNRLEERLALLVREGFAPLRSEAEKRCDLSGRRVTIRIGDEDQTGIAAGIGAAGGLLLWRDGRTEEIRLGEVTRVRPIEREEGA